ncbi:Inosine/uridine-preferring nucleoside hydrolase domain-containing protein [Cercophora samala]|uniref:Inosine/uridine-preferring nucleoside hydrolase domain-containing protein n=1 Tax=Cercophora samala TaxID=330535 RepID=A0AA39ZLE9_9PEZI|nr:Inosine/uridine-preferring nucleoside hydrolase domain-containing protein [Cercophora samala]
MSDTRIPVWLDCDPGHDDTFAILLAAYHPAIRILGVSTVFGNASLEKTTHNATSILTAISQSASIPVYIGASKALFRPPMHPPTDIHGETGLDGTALLPTPLVPPITTVPAIDAAYAALKSTAPGTAWVVATGSFTNAAALFMKYPELIPHIAGLSLMGGALGNGFTPAILGTVDGVPRIGNWTQFAEFNILADPEAASFLLTHKDLCRKTTLIPLDVTHLCLTTAEVQELILYGPEGLQPGMTPGKGKTKLRQMLVELLLFFAKTYADVFGITEGPPLHDPLAVAAVLSGLDGEEGGHKIPFYEHDPSVGVGIEGKGERYEVSVVTEGTYEEAKAGARTGQITARLLPPGEEGVRIPRGLDLGVFWRVLEECISRADEANERAGAVKKEVGVPGA